MSDIMSLGPGSLGLANPQGWNEHTQRRCCCRTRWLRSQYAGRGGRDDARFQALVKYLHRAKPPLATFVQHETSHDRKVRLFLVI